MKTFAEFLAESHVAHPILKHFWDTHSSHLRFYAVPDNCGHAAADLNAFINETTHITNNDIVYAGSYKNGTKCCGGFVHLDVPFDDEDALSANDIHKMQQMNLNFNSSSDRMKYMKLSGDDKYNYARHAWVEIKEARKIIILDPSGFYPNNTGQFDKFVRSHENLSKRYVEF